LLNRPNIYHTPIFRKKYTIQARENLEEQFRELHAVPTP
jgi:predicted metal-dependent HD superfamily phosphohydrolase